MMVFLLACTPASHESDSASGETGMPGDCDYSENAPRIALEWNEAGSAGVSAEEAFFGDLGVFWAELWWEDGESSVLGLAFAALQASEIDAGPACPVAIEARVQWDAHDDRSIALTGETTWILEDTATVKRASVVGVFEVISPEDIGLDALDAASTTRMDAYRYDVDGRVTFVIQESWALDATTARSCVRVSDNADAVGCRDTLVQNE
jgi:hypothetical protein